jgi:hypothetical protein
MELRESEKKIEGLLRHRESCADNLLTGYETGKTEERQNVVAWLKRMAGNARHWGGDDNTRAEIYDNIVDVFECGEHRREEKE